VFYLFGLYMCEDTQELKTDTTTKTKQAPSATDTPEVDVVTGELAQEITLSSCLKTTLPLIFKLFIAINLPSIAHPVFVSLLLYS
jgi:hypothetical protein